MEPVFATTYYLELRNHLCRTFAALDQCGCESAPTEQGNGEFGPYADFSEDPKLTSIKALGPSPVAGATSSEADSVGALSSHTAAGTGLPLFRKTPTAAARSREQGCDRGTINLIATL